MKEASEVRPWKSKASSPAGGYANGAETADVGVRLALPGQAHGLEAPAPQPKGNDLVLASGAGHTLTRVIMLTRTPATLQESLETRLFPYVSSCRRREEGGKKKKKEARLRNNSICKSRRSRTCGRLQKLGVEGGGNPSGTRPHPQCLLSEAGALRAAPPAGVLCDRWEEKWGHPRSTPPRTQCRAIWAWRVG